MNSAMNDTDINNNAGLHHFQKRIVNSLTPLRDLGTLFSEAWFAAGALFAFILMAVLISVLYPMSRSTVADEPQLLVRRNAIRRHHFGRDPADMPPTIA